MPVTRHAPGRARRPVRALLLRHRPSPSPTRLGPRAAGAVGLAVLLVGFAAAARGELATRAADAAVTPASGFSGTVAGWTSWYGAYDLADLGWAWCVDHGSRAPDPDLVYAPTSITGETDASGRAAIAWAVTMNPPHDAVTSAAIMLVVHDLRDATYPAGPLDVDRMGTGDLVGFGGAEGAVLERARAIKADARAHAHLRQPFTLQVSADRAAPGAPGAVRAALTDAAGAPVTGVAVRLEAGGAVLDASSSFTGDDGVAWFGFRAGPAENRFAAHADLPRTEPDVHAPTVAPAQRVVVPAWAAADGSDAYAPPATTTTTTMAPTTTTTRPPATTTTTRPPATTTTTSTTAPPRSTTTTSPPPTTSTTSSVPTTTSTTSTTTTSTTAATPPTTGAPRSGPPGPGAPPATTLPRTGRATWPWALIGTGLVTCGWTLTSATRRPSRRRSP